MIDALIQLFLFAAKSIIVVLLILLVLVAFFGLLSRGKQKLKGRLHIKNINKKYEEAKEAIYEETLSKKELKAYAKELKAHEKAEQKGTTKNKNIYVINFHGDMRATAVDALREEITAILNVAKPSDEVIIRLESAGGVVHGYGLGAAQLLRIRNAGIPLTISIDKVAASGGYLMSCVANKIIAAPFAIIGSIGVLVQLPNFHRLLKDKHIDFEQITAGEFKRTITLFGENTEEARRKLKQEIEEVHQIFKNVITDHRPQIDIDKVATGEHWLAVQAIGLKLVDEIKTSDDYLLERSKDAKLYEVCFEVKKSLLGKLTGGSANSSLPSQIGEKLLTSKIHSQ